MLARIFVNNLTSMQETSYDFVDVTKDAPGNSLEIY